MANFGIMMNMKEIEEIGFWKWAFSDFISNALRGVLAEYIVASAVGCTHNPRTEWDAFDLETGTGLKIEVKSAAYLQSWEQKAPSSIRFDIAPKRSWSAATNTISADPLRAADVYVFCVFTTTERAQANPRDLNQWIFFVCSTRQLNEAFGPQKSAALSSLLNLGLIQCSYPELAERIHSCVAPSR